jgi:hypothetical protein
MNYDDLISQHVSARKQSLSKITSNKQKSVLTKEQKFELRYEKTKQKYFDKIVKAYREGEDFVEVGNWETTQDYSLFVVNKLKELGHNAETAWEQDYCDIFKYRILVRF